MSTEFAIHGSHQGINDLRDYLEEFGRQWSLSKKTTSELNIALEELCTNYIEHSADHTPETMSIQISRSPSEIVVIITDNGPPFDPTQAESPDIGLTLEDRKIGGLGLHFVKHFTDQLLYKRAKNQNIVTIIKKRKTNIQE